MRKTLLTFLIIFVATTAWAQSKTLKLKAYTVENLTNDPLKQAEGVILDAVSRDTVSVATRSMAYEGYGKDMTLKVTLSFSVPRVPGKYIIEASCPGYKAVYRNIEIDKIGGREFEKRIDDLVFHKAPKELSEVVVNASKVKFYNKGDTLVYNADAFQLAEGSMLDVLVKQLPGVEVKEGGRIYVNGKFVESLLLNGKDFFRGNNSLMLNNLGAYTVRDIAVYDKWGERSLLAGRDLGDSEYVMDVRLKREYMSGYIGNVGAGAGTSGRYLSRLFGLWYTTRSRVGIIGNFNNLNDSRTPGQNDEWKPSQTPGDIRTKMGGLDYNVSDNNKVWEFKGNTTVSHTRDNAVSNTSRTNFIPEGDTYEKSTGRTLSHDFSLSTRNSLIFRRDKRYLSIGQSLGYRNSDIESTVLAGSFSQEIRELTQLLLEQIYSGEASSFFDRTINTRLTRLKDSGHSLEASGYIYGSTAFEHSPDLVSLSVSGEYKESTSRMFNLYDIRYPRQGTQSTDYRYTRNSPDRSWNFKVSPSYEFLYSPEGAVEFYPSYTHFATRKDSYFYDLDRQLGINSFGSLPAGYQSGLNNDQTYFSTETSDVLGLVINARWRKEYGEGRTLSYGIYPVVNRRWRRLDYRQGSYEAAVRHSSTDIEFGNTNIAYSVGSNNYKLLYERRVQLAPLYRMVGAPDTRDPLNIYVGSENLKNAANNTLTFEWGRFVRTRHRWGNLMRLSYSIVENGLANCYTFNPQTGVRTYSMRNVRGNDEWRLFNNFSKTFGPKDQFDVYWGTDLTYGHAVDFVGITSEALEKSRISNLVVTQGLQLLWKLGKHTFTLKGKISWRNTDGDNSGFSDFSSTTSQYGASAVLSLPCNFGLSTDLTMYSRRGYSDPALNTTDVVWNARLSYTLKGGRWVFMIDGFDLLHSLSNVTYNVNAQGRVETWTNVLPSYGLLHVQYRFAIQPKKK